MADRAHNYDYPVDTSSETAAAKVIRFVGLNKRVLEIGCGPGSITKILHGQKQCLVTGVELDPDAIQLVTPYCDRVVRADLNNADWHALSADLGQFETIVVADVLEHLYDPWTILSNLKTLLQEGGEVVISLPHVGHAAIAACLLSGDFDYRDWGLLDRTHIRFFGLKNIDCLFTQAGFKVVKVSFVTTPPEETEFALIWATLNPDVQKVLRGPAHSDIYQVVIKAVPVEAEGTAISISESISQNSDSLKRPVTLRARITALLSSKQKAFIRNWMKASV
jgi:2-polyprenyl-3-methyl-5-hydroxy-6-metoxy-1,4-benzoquinol methylase